MKKTTPHIALCDSLYLHPVNHPGTPPGKRWLAWLISEYRKYGLAT